MNEMERFEKAFADELAANPEVAPSPTALNRRMGKTTGLTNTINGRLSKRRRELLEAAGFYQDTSRNYLGGRWKKRA